MVFHSSLLLYVPQKVARHLKGGSSNGTCLVFSRLKSYEQCTSHGARMHEIAVPVYNAARCPPFKKKSGTLDTGMKFIEFY